MSLIAHINLCKMQCFDNSLNVCDKINCEYEKLLLLSLLLSIFLELLLPDAGMLLSKYDGGTS